MIAMYEKYGYYKDAVQAISLKGIEGLEKIQKIMEYFRNNTPAEFAGSKVISVRDYKADTIRDMASGPPTCSTMTWRIRHGCACARPEQSPRSSSITA